MNAEKQEFLRLYENFPKLSAAIGNFSKEPSREKEICLDRLMEAAFWFKAYWDFLHPPSIEGIEVVARDKKTGKEMGKATYGTKTEIEKPN